MPRSTTARRSCRVALAGIGAALLLSGCGFAVQTLQPYTPAQGVNVDAGDVLVRNLLIVADGEGGGIISGSLLSSVDNRVTDINVTPVLMDDTDGTPLEVYGADDVELPANRLVPLSTEGEQVQVSGEDLSPGLTARFVLTFESGAEAAVTAPVMAFDQAMYAPLSPTAPPTTATQTPIASPAAPTTAAVPATTPTTTP